MRQEWLENCGGCGGRLKRYDVAGWIRQLVEMNVIRKDMVTLVSQSIRRRMEDGYIPWKEESNEE